VKQKKAAGKAALVRIAYFRYPAEMASTGQESAQAPQSVQVFASITKMSSPWLMASTGQVDSHAPQEMHSLEMTYAMIVLLLIG